MARAVASASGVPAADAGFALATVGLGSAVMLNILLFFALMVSIPLRGVNPVYGTAAVVGVILLVFSAGVVVGLLQGQARAERLVRWVARKLRFDPDRAVSVIRHVADRMRYLLRDRPLLARVAVYAALNWLLDAAALWFFLRAFGGSISVDGLLVAFCLANVLAVIPITPVCTSRQSPGSASPGARHPSGSSATDSPSTGCRCSSVASVTCRCASARGRWSAVTAWRGSDRWPTTRSWTPPTPSSGPRNTHNAAPARSVWGL